MLILCSDGCRLNKTKSPLRKWRSTTKPGPSRNTLAALPPAQTPEPGGTIRYRGEALRIEHDENGRRKPVAAEGVIRIGGPAQALPGRLRRWLEAQARRLSAATGVREERN